MKPDSIIEGNFVSYFFLFTVPINGLSIIEQECGGLDLDK